MLVTVSLEWSLEAVSLVYLEETLNSMGLRVVDRKLVDEREALELVCYTTGTDKVEDYEKKIEEYLGEVLDVSYLQFVK